VKRKKLKAWPCGCDMGNPWHYDCRDPRCKAASRESGESLGVNCVRVGAILLAVAFLQGCGFYVHRGGGSYTFIGPGNRQVAARCSPLWYEGWR